jgi:hypothetical protein
MRDIVCNAYQIKKKSKGNAQNMDIKKIKSRTIYITYALPIRKST